MLLKCLLIFFSKTSVNLFVKARVPKYFISTFLYTGWFLKYYSSLFKAIETLTLLLISYCDLFLIPTKPKANGISWFKIIFLASVPLSMISIFVMTPNVLCPVGSHFLAKSKPWEVDISALAGRTAKMIVLSSTQYLLAMSMVTFSISYWCPTEILVIPGKSISVKSGHSYEYTLNNNGNSYLWAW